MAAVRHDDSLTGGRKAGETSLQVVQPRLFIGSAILIVERRLQLLIKHGSGGWFRSCYGNGLQGGVQSGGRSGRHESVSTRQARVPEATTVPRHDLLLGTLAGTFRRWYGVAQNRSAAFADIVAIPFRNLNQDVAFHYGLAAQTRTNLEISGLLDAIEFVVFHLGQVLFALFDYHVASRAGAVTAAGMLQMETEVHRDIEQRFRKPVPFVGQLPMLEFKRLSRGEESYFRH
jgi:hypothetical protein